MGELVTKVGETCRKRKVDALLIEDKARGHDAAAEIKLQFGDRAWSTHLLNPQGLKGRGGSDKIARLKAVQPMFSGDAIEQKDARGRPTGVTIWTGGLVWAPDMAYAEEVITEVEKFPRGAHDDYVDTVSQFFLWARRRGEIKRAVEHAQQERAANTWKPKATPLYNV